MESALMNVLTSPAVFAAVFLGASVLILFYILKLFKTERDVLQKPKKEQTQAQVEKKKEVAATGKSKKKVAETRWSNRSEKQSYSHAWLLVNLKGHTGQILDLNFSSNGKYLASCGDDGAVLLWDTKDFTQKDRKSLRVNIEFDHATLVKWSPDSKAFIINKFNENAVEVYKVEKKKDGWLTASKASTFPKVHDTDVIGMGIASNGKFIMTCSNKTTLIIWDLKGQELATLSTNLLHTTCAKISPCGRFIVASGFAPDVVVWEVIFSKSGEFQEVKRAFLLVGHSSGVYDVAFDVDTSHMATVSKDGTWKLYDTKIEYKQGQDPYLKITGKYKQSGNHALIALSPNAEVIVIATSNSLAFYSAMTGKLDYTVENVYSGDITCVIFDATGKYVLTSGDKQIRVFHNVTGYRCAIETAKEKLKEKQTSATKERLEKLIFDSEAFLKSIDK